MDKKEGRHTEVPAAVYDEAYYRQACGGYEHWIASEGREVWGMYPAVLAKARLEPGEVVADFGTGRGEILVCALEAGASHAIGIDYSADAIGLARQTASVHEVADRVTLLNEDLRDTGLEGASVDLVTMLDVVEHLNPNELHETLLEVRRILRKDGRVVVHTMPNRLMYTVTYRALRWSSPRRLLTWPVDPRNDYERSMHVNEQSRRSLRRALVRAGFGQVSVRHGEWVMSHFVPDERVGSIYQRLARHRSTVALGAADLWAEARQP